MEGIQRVRGLTCRSITVLAVLVLVATAGRSVEAQVELEVGRFFDRCIEPDTSIEQANGEACIVQAIFDAFSTADNGVTVDLLPSHRDGYYAQLIALYSSDTPPDIHILHRHRLPDFASAGLLAPLEEGLAAAGIDVEDWHPAARDAVTLDGRILAVPFDLHANLWHINLTLLSDAGLVGGDGKPILPSSPGELLEHSRLVKDATGMDYLAADFVQFPIGLRSILSLLWQQDQELVDGTTAMVDSAEMRAAITTFTDLFDAGLADPKHDYESAQQAFLDGEVAVLINGTWAVDLYDRQVARGEVALKDYDVADFPTLFERPATWADLHLWAIPATLATRDPEAYEAALGLLAWIDDHDLDWARTGHLAVRRSVLESEAYATLSHRPDYRDTIARGRYIDVASGYDDIQIVLVNNLPPIWLEGRSMDEALAEAQGSIERLLR